MSDIKSRDWYDAMQKDVKEILETLVLLDASFTGYINKKIDEQPITLSWNEEVVTVTADKFKWQMPIAWFIDPELVARVIPPSRELMEPVAKPQPRPVRTHGVDDDEPPVAEPAQVVTGDTLVVGGIKVPAGVKSVDEILAEQGLDDDGD